MRGSRLIRATAAALAGAAVLGHAGPAVLGRGRWRERVVPGLLGRGAPGGVALTFDDGPHPEGTPAVRRALDELGVRATFFVLGSQVDRHPGHVAALLADGHEVALHGYEHRNHLTRTAPALVADLDRARAAVVRDAVASGLDPLAVEAGLLFTRPPYGAVSGGTLWAARASRLRPVLWTAWGRDWLGHRGDRVAATVLADLARDAPDTPTPVRQGGGTVLLHDSDCTSVPGSWRGTVAALPTLVAAVRERGWEPRLLSEHLQDSGDLAEPRDIGSSRTTTAVLP
ncbi:Polysaccharide deacetylase [Quadrisphaera granulorum]|uniref:Polysaccharide deacetylase n=1 Tax=Quadrisphaera granulorum TaxID=317664 RepID=A0A316AHE6_9ACTN|nr:polysaccharide deacetylase family protein [Quadrisphaera granulorum]PWJ56360.1 polysaccharide deacetylase [Quadrisphaera granulorum]SZE94994.1 Polysaccharide deacetylase [Quadrisphaera granulorum]